MPQSRQIHLARRPVPFRLHRPQGQAKLQISLKLVSDQLSVPARHHVLVQCARSDKIECCGGDQNEGDRHQRLAQTLTISLTTDQLLSLGQGRQVLGSTDRVGQTCARTVGLKLHIHEGVGENADYLGSDSVADQSH